MCQVSNRDESRSKWWAQAKLIDSEPCTDAEILVAMVIAVSIVGAVILGAQLRREESRAPAPKCCPCAEATKEAIQDGD